MEIMNDRAIVRLIPVIKEITSEDITPEFLENLGELKEPTIQIEMAEDEVELNYYNKIASVLKRLKELGLESKVEFNILHYYSVRNSDLYAHLWKPNLIVHYKSDIYRDEEWNTFCSIIWSLLKEIELLRAKEELSSFEIYLAIYDKCRKFMKYKLSPDEAYFKGRSLKDITLNGKYICCVGFSNLLVAMLDFYGIEAFTFCILMADKQSAHARVLVKLDDDKYNIHGIYISDPTFGSNREQDIINYALMTFDETTWEYHHVHMNMFLDFIMNVHSKDEFIYKINVLKRHINNLHIDCGGYLEYASSIWGFINSKINCDCYIVICREVLLIIKRLDYNYYLKLASKYPSFENEKTCFSFLNEVGDYIVNLTNKQIPQNVIYETYFKIKCMMHDRNPLTYEAQEELQSLIEENKKHYFNYFWDFWPYEDQLGTFVKKR